MVLKKGLIVKEATEKLNETELTSKYRPIGLGAVRAATIAAARKRPKAEMDRSLERLLLPEDLPESTV